MKLLFSKISIIVALLVFVFPEFSAAQGTAFGFKIGPSISYQNWDFGQRDPLFAYHAALSVESLPEDDRFSIFAQAGYHVKGGAVRYSSGVFTNPVGGLQGFNGRTDRFEFNNVSLLLGAKQALSTGKFRSYYLFGIRGEFTVSTNLDEYRERNERFNSFFFPQDNWVRKINYGVTVGGGFDFFFLDKIAGLIEIRVNPDFSKQYVQPALTTTNPFTLQPQSFQERSFSNLNLEISLGVRFIREVEYID